MTDYEGIAVKKLKPGDVIRFSGQDETIAEITPNPGNPKLYNIRLTGLKSVLVEHGNAAMLKVGEHT